MINRRSVLLGGLAAGVLGGCTRTPEQPFVAVNGPEVRAAEAARVPGRVIETRLEVTVSNVDLGGTTVSTWSYGGRIAGAPLRVKAGDQVKGHIG